MENTMFNIRTYVLDHSIGKKLFVVRMVNIKDCKSSIEDAHHGPPQAQLQVIFS